ncbi:unnamed protein product [Symbiodinium pilosum]|uniref:Uncharacterized protein n=1 Tax=Symbiodinium pilosum TaxID=2952 RepID=A0A812LBD1_SYMPI|nr:unnamed protein product [Symbiodinium pilosum]
MLSPRKLGLRSAPPNLNQWEEGDDEDYDDVDEDLDEDQYGNSTDLTSPDEEHPQWQWDERMAPEEEVWVS